MPIFGQELALINKTSLEADEFIGFDEYGHLYYIKDQVLYKKGDLGFFEFQDFQLGPVSSVDIINPLNIVVFYEEVSTVIFLDNRLNEKDRIIFNELPSFLNVSHVTNAGNNRLWIFNFDNQQLELFHYRTQQETVVSQPFSGKIVSQISNFMDCTLLTDSYLRQVNIYGSLLFEMPLKGFTKIVQYGSTFIGLKENSLFNIEKDTIKSLELEFKENPIKDLQLTQDFLYIYNGKTLFTYSLTQPK